MIKQNKFYLAFILVLAFIVFSPCLINGFLIYDDPENVTGNTYITSFSFQNIKVFFTTPLLFMYSPLVFISFAIDYSIAGLSPLVFHFTNLLLHLINVCLVFVLLRKLSGKIEAALIAAVLFAVHPVNADSIAWISTRSNLLFTLFFLASLIFYVSFITSNFRKHWYMLSLLCFLFSALSKSAAVVLPLILMLIDYYLQRKIRLKQFAEKIPLLIIAVLAGMATFYFRTDVGSMQTLHHYSIADKILIFSFSISSYLFKLFFPFNLSAVYTYPPIENHLLPLKFYFAPLIFLLLLVLVFKIKPLKRELIFGFLFFLVCVSISQLGFLEDGFMANRYAYLAYIPLFFIVGNIYSLITKNRKAFILILAAFIITSSIITYNYVQLWKDNLTLFNDVIEKQPTNAFAFNLRGIARFETQDYEGSVADYSNAINLNSVYPESYYNRGISYYQLKNFEEALHDYSKAIELNPQSSKSYMARGIIKMDAYHNQNAAIEDYNKAIELNPSFAQAYYNRGLAELKMNNRSQACEDFKQVKGFGYSQADELIMEYCR